MARETEFEFANYDGGLSSHPVPERAGILLIKPGGDWELHYAGRLGKPSGNTTFRIANYDGSSPFHKKREAAGQLVFTPESRWELHFEGTSRWFWAGVTRCPLEVTPTGPASCRVSYQDVQDPKNAAAWDLPETEAAALEAALDLYQADRWIFGGIRRYPLRATGTGSSSCHVAIQDVQLPTAACGFDLPSTSAPQFENELRRQLQAVATNPVTAARSSGTTPGKALAAGPIGPVVSMQRVEAPPSGRYQSSFTATCRHQALGAWRGFGKWPTGFANWRKQLHAGESVTSRAGTGCCGCLLMGPVWFMIPFLFSLLVWTGLVVYALVFSVLWGLGAAIDAVSHLGHRGSGD